LKQSISLSILRNFLFIFVVCLSRTEPAFCQAQDSSSQIKVVAKENYSYFSPLLRLPDKSRIDQGLLAISLVSPMPKASLLKSLFDKRNEQLNKHTSFELTEINQLQEYYKASYPKNNFELDIELSLFKSGKLIRGQLKYLKAGEEVTSLEVLQIPPPSESNLGNYFFVQGGVDNIDSPLTILSPVTKKCRGIPVEGKGDQILLSGMSMSDIFFSFSSKDPMSFTNVLREELLVPESKLVRDNELDKGAKVLHEIDRYGLKEVQLINAKALSLLYARPNALIHFDIKSGIPYQVQFLLEGTNKKGVIMYSWIRLEDGTSVPKEISYYEEKGSAKYEIISKLDIVNIRKSDVGAGAFRDELGKLLLLYLIHCL